MQSKDPQRAKLFLSFDSLTPYKQFIKDKEVVIPLKQELTSDERDQMDYTLSTLQVGDMVGIVYYDHQEYLKKTGMITKMDLLFKEAIWIVGEMISFAAILEIEVQPITIE